METRKSTPDSRTPNLVKSNVIAKWRGVMTMVSPSATGTGLTRMISNSPIAVIVTIRMTSRGIVITSRPDVDDEDVAFPSRALSLPAKV